MSRTLPPGPANGWLGLHHARAMQNDILGFARELGRAYGDAVYFLSREAHEPVQIGGYEIPRGVQIHLVPYLVHHDQRWWSEPEKFAPIASRLNESNKSALSATSPLALAHVVV